MTPRHPKHVLPARFKRLQTCFASFFAVHFSKWWKTVPLSTSLAVLAKHARPPNPVTVTATPTLTLSPYLLLPFSSAPSRFMAPWWLKVSVCLCVCDHLEASKYGCECICLCREMSKRICVDIKMCEHACKCGCAHVGGSVCVCVCISDCAWMVPGLCNSPRRRIAGLQLPCFLSWDHRSTGSRRSS